MFNSKNNSAIFDLKHTFLKGGTYTTQTNSHYSTEDCVISNQP